MTSSRPTTPRPLLTAAMIVRDEELHIGACLASLAGVVDEVVVVDTGSVDDTVAVARSHGATVFTEPWADDFSRARNAALDRARGEWILYIDADERVQPIDRDEVVALLGSVEHVAFRVLLHPFADATACREYRLWRNDPRIRFEGVIHEKVVPSIRAVAAAGGLQVGQCDLTIRHLGYVGDQTRKHLRNLPLLQAQLEAEPGNVFNWRHLANVSFGLGRDDEGEAALDRARDVLRQSADPPALGALVYADLIRRRRGGLEDAVLVDEGLATYPHDPFLRWAKAAVGLDDGRPESALAELDRLLATDPADLDDTMSYDERLFGAGAHAARGLCLFRLGRYDDAAAAYRVAERLEPDVEQHWVTRRMAERLAERDRPPVPWARTVDVTGIPVEFTASDAVHAEAVEAAVGMLPVTDTPAEVEVAFTASGTLSWFPWEHADGDVRARWDGGDVLRLAHGAVQALVDASSARLEGDDDLRRAFRQLLPYVLTHLLATRDRFVLHGGAIVRDGGAALVLGPTGSGKSTVAVRALDHGWSVLSDDLAAVRLGPAGPEVRGIAKPLLAPALVARQATAPGQPLPGDARERWVVTGIAADDRWHPVVATIVSARAEADDGVSVLDGDELFRWLLFSFLDARDETRLRAFLPVATALAACGGGVLRHGRRSSAQGAFVDALLTEVRDSSGSPPRPPGSSTGSSCRTS